MNKALLKSLRRELDAAAAAHQGDPATSASQSQDISIAEPVQGARAVASVAPSAQEAPQPVTVQSESEGTRVSPPPKRQRVGKASSSSTRAEPGAVGGLDVQQILNPRACLATLYAITHASRIVTDYITSLEGRLKERDELSKKAGDLAQRLKESKADMARLQAAFKSLSSEHEVAKRDFDVKLGELEAAKVSAEVKAETLESTLGEINTALTEAQGRIQELDMLLLEKDAEIAKAHAETREERIKCLVGFEKGYAEAVSHVKFLHPEEDVSRYNPWYEVVDGELKDPDEGKEEGASKKADGAN